MSELATPTIVPTFVSIVAPCFNEVAGIAELVRRCSESAHLAVDNSYEIILVDDGSVDGTWSVMLDQIQKTKNLVVIKLSRNFGHQVALTAGLSAVTGNVVLVIDGDLQDPPELLPEMLQVMKTNSADVVYGRRTSRAGEGWFKRRSASLFYRLLEKMTAVTIPVDAGDFRLMSRRVSDLVAQMPERDRFIRGMVASVGFTQVPFDYQRHKRFAGETKYPLAKMINFAIDAFLGYSMTLLRFSSIAAVGLLLALIGVAIYSLYSWMFLFIVPGWTSVIILIIVVSFFQLVSLSIIGEYVGRIYLSGKGRPLFIIDSIRQSTMRAPNNHGID
jgi:dolichol-phosphate mannosyltransferase